MALTLNLVGDPEADTLLASDPLALLIGMLLDQQVPMETAFAGPKKLDDRLGGLDVHKIAEMSPDDFIAVCAQPPAVHRFPKSMGERIQSLCGYIVEHYDGDTAAIWTSGRPSGKEVLKRLKALPGTATRRPEFSWRCWVSRSAYSRRAGVRRPEPTVTRALVGRSPTSSTGRHCSRCANSSRPPRLPRRRRRRSRRSAPRYR